MYQWYEFHRHLGVVTFITSDIMPTRADRDAPEIIMMGSDDGRQPSLLHKVIRAMFRQSVEGTPSDILVIRVKADHWQVVLPPETNVAPLYIYSISAHTHREHWLAPSLRGNQYNYRFLPKSTKKSGYLSSDSKLSPTHSHVRLPK